MKNSPLTTLFKGFVLCFVIVFNFSNAFGWGFWAHKRINRAAALTLPPKMIGFYKNHLSYITENATNPDLRRYIDPNEAPRHYMDLDHYGKYPFSTVPHNFADACLSLTEDTLNKYGTVPFQINKVYNKLVTAMKEGNQENILRYSADLGHYVGDACVPLHSTLNYDGQMTGQKGIHALWESNVPEKYGDKYNFFVGKPEVIDSVQGYAFTLILESSQGLDLVLGAEKNCSGTIAMDKKFIQKQVGTKTKKLYSDEFLSCYNDKVATQVQNRLLRAVKAVSSLWYTAWVNAGQPDLDKLILYPLSKVEEEKLKKEAKEVSENKWKFDEGTKYGVEE